MNFQKATAVLLSALIACFLSGCDMPIEFPASNESQSSSAFSNNSNNDSPDSISEPVTTVMPNANISDPDISESEDSALSNSVTTDTPELTETQIEDICKNGYFFFKQYQLGQGGVLPYDLDDKIILDNQTYAKLTSFNSKQEFVEYCTAYFSDSFIDQNINPWFESENACILQRDNSLYYKLPEGTGIISSLSPTSVQIEQASSNEFLIFWPLWDPNIERELDSSVKFTLINNDGKWKIDAIVEGMN